MFFSKVVLFAISLGALSVVATPHALHHHALHRRVVAARAAAPSKNATALRQNSQKCNHHPPPASSSSIPAPTHIIAAPNPPPPATTPTPTPTPKPSTSTPQQQPAPTTTPTTSPQLPAGFPPGTHSGDGTFYSPGLGACGVTNVDSDFIVAISHSLYDSIPDDGNPNNNAFCRKQVIITGPNGNTETAVIEDRCQGCQEFDLDMTPDLFNKFADPATGRIHITWRFA